jgi:MFS family permease
MFFASALIALLPSVARTVSDSPTGYGVLLGCFGAGAVLGAAALPWARARWSTETAASVGVAMLGSAMIAVGSLHSLRMLAPVMLVAGAAWIAFISIVNALIQLLAPDWVRARVLAVFMLVFQGSLAAGSAIWGSIAGRGGIQLALLIAGVGVILSVALRRVATLPDTAADPSPWNHWKFPIIVGESEPALDAGPVLVTSEYIVIPEAVDAFVDATADFARLRRRDGAYSWGLFRDVEKTNTYVEVFLVDSWAEHIRQHERATQVDRAIEGRVLNHVSGQPTVRHFVAPRRGA